MHLPKELQEAIALEADKFKLHEISSAREQLTESYRGPKIKKRPLITNDAQRCAYVVSRLPATYAVIYRVFKELLQRVEGLSIESLLDLGAGPGTVMWAANQLFPTIGHYSLIERDHSLMAFGKRLASHAKVATLLNARWHFQSMEELKEIAEHDLVVFSYSAGELPEGAIKSLIRNAWQLTKRYLIVIEPGTPKGFEVVRESRDALIELGGHLIAPCPHAAACPMEEGNWCHFSERIERSFLHRHIKKGSLGYEDEKFSYIIASKEPSQFPEARVLRYPHKHSGHVTLEVCTAEGVKQRVVSKRTPDFYKQARNLEWGSAIEIRETYVE